MKRYILTSFAMFFGAALTGFLATLAIPEIAENFMLELEPLVEALIEMTSWQMFLLYLINNTLTSFIAMVSGIAFGILPAFMILLNGIIPGMLFYIFWDEGTHLTFILGIMPHGIIEVPAFLVSAALGLKLGVSTIMGIKQGKERTQLVTDIRSELKENIVFFAKYLVPLFLVAAAIEAFITPLLV